MCKISISEVTYGGIWTHKLPSQCLTQRPLNLGNYLLSYSSSPRHATWKYRHLQKKLNKKFQMKHHSFLNWVRRRQVLSNTPKSISNGWQPKQDLKQLPFKTFSQMLVIWIDASSLCYNQITTVKYLATLVISLASSRKESLASVILY